MSNRFASRTRMEIEDDDIQMVLSQVAASKPNNPINNTNNTNNDNQDALNFRTPTYSLNQIQQLFIHSFMSRQCIADDDVDHMITEYNQCLPSTKTTTQRSTRSSSSSALSITKNGLIASANRALRSIGFVIKRGYDPIDSNNNNNQNNDNQNNDNDNSNRSTAYYVLSNEIEDKLCASQNCWSPKESEFYFALLDAIVKTFVSSSSSETTESNENANNNEDDDNANNHTDLFRRILSIGSTNAINLARPLNLSLILAEKLLRNWIASRWFAYCGDRTRVTIGVRSAALASAYLGARHSIAACFTCHFACFVGLRCDRCGVCLHRRCALDQCGGRGGGTNSSTIAIYCPSGCPAQSIGRATRPIFPISDQNQDDQEAAATEEDNNLDE